MSPSLTSLSSDGSSLNNLGHGNLRFGLYWQKTLYIRFSQESMKRRGFVSALIPLVSGCSSLNNRDGEGRDTTSSSTMTPEEPSGESPESDRPGWIQVSNYHTDEISYQLEVSKGENMVFSQGDAVQPDSETVYTDVITSSGTYDIYFIMNGESYRSEISADLSDGSGWQGVRIDVKSTTQVEIYSIYE